MGRVKRHSPLSSFLEAECPNFINADLFTEGINPFHPEASSIQASKQF
jgi:predicted ABC-type ATPase